MGQHYLALFVRPNRSSYTISKTSRHVRSAAATASKKSRFSGGPPVSTAFSLCPQRYTKSLGATGHQVVGKVSSTPADDECCNCKEQRNERHANRAASNQFASLFSESPIFSSSRVIFNSLTAPPLMKTSKPRKPRIAAPITMLQIIIQPYIRIAMLRCSRRFREVGRGTKWNRIQSQ